MTSELSIRNSLLSLIIFSLLGVLLFVAQVALSWIPNVELVSVLLIVYTRVYGARTFYPLAVFVLLEGLWYGFGTWFFNYLYVWAVLVAAALIFRRMTSPVAWAILSGFFGLLFGGLCALLYGVMGGPAAMLAYWLSGLWFDVIHCVGNLVVALVLVDPLYRLLSRLSQARK